MARGKTIYVVTGLELGWDCVTAAFNFKRDAEDDILFGDDGDIESLTEEQRKEALEEAMYVIHEVRLR